MPDQKQKKENLIKSFSFKSPVLLGGLAGAVNGFLCYAKIPVPVGGWNQFKIHIILAGACHGAILAGVIRLFTSLFYGRNPRIQWAGLVLCSYVAGWLCFIPIRLSNADKAWDFGAFLWPFDSDGLGFLWVPVVYFGLVASFYYLFLVIFKRLYSRELGPHLLAGVVSGIAGSLWWWNLWKPWTLSLVHGTIWGLLTGFGMAMSAAEAQSKTPR